MLTVRSILLSHLNIPISTITSWKSVSKRNTYSMADFCLQTTFFYANHQKMELHIVLRRSRDTVAALGRCGLTGCDYARVPKMRVILFTNNRLHILGTKMRSCTKSFAFDINMTVLFWIWTFCFWQRHYNIIIRINLVFFNKS